MVVELAFQLVQHERRDHGAEEQVRAVAAVDQNRSRSVQVRQEAQSRRVKFGDRDQQDTGEYRH
jgi:hypothetical protein